jgi:protein-L-isoaspartate(D-aspartate) O-methyltransferase
MGGESKDTLVASLRGHVADERVLAAIASVPRDAFVPADLQDRAWDNEALPIGHGQTISQPLVVAHMCALLDVGPGHRVLDVGTGSGYHAAILAALGAQVWSVERDAELSAIAADNLRRADVAGVQLLVGDGTLGLPSRAPFDAVNVAAAAKDRVPRALTDQLASGGRLVLPVGEQLVYVTRDRQGRLQQPRAHGAVRFVPLVGED